MLFGCYGYPRATDDMDVWIELSPANAAKTVAVLKAFGFDVPELSEQLFLDEDAIVRMGNPPLRLEILTRISESALQNAMPPENEF